MKTEAKRYFNRLLWVIDLIMIIGLFCYIAYYYDALPDTIAIHFDLHDNPNGYSCKFAIWLLYALNIASIGCVCGLTLVPKSAWKRMNVDKDLKGTPINIFILLMNILFIYCAYTIISFNLNACHQN